MMIVTDDELATYCGLAPDDPLRKKFIVKLKPETRALFERMHRLEAEINFWQEGVGPKPKGVLLDMDTDRRIRRTWGL